MEKDLDKTVEILVGLLKGRASGFEIFLSSTEGVSVEAKEGKVDAFKLKKSVGAGIRTISGNRPGFAFSSVLTDDALEKTVSLALSGSLGASEDPLVSFPFPKKSNASLDLLDDSFAKTTEEEKINTALRIEECAMSFDKRIKRVRKASYGETFSFSRVVNSNGVDASESSTFYSASVMAVAEDKGESQMGWETGMGHKRKAIDPCFIGNGASVRAIELLGARQIGTIKCPAVFENIVVTEFISAISMAFCADSVQKGKSVLAGKKGKKVVSDKLNVFDDGVMKDGWGSSLFDAEGVPRQKTALFIEGVLQGFLYDTYWAKREGVESTGNAERGGFKGFPSIGVSNLYIEKGDKTLEALFKDMGKGLFIKEIMGAHTIDPISGDFSLGATGFWVENGVLAYPVRGIAIAGNLLELFSGVSAAGSDMRFMGSVGAPSLLFSELSASGA